MSRTVVLSVMLLLSACDVGTPPVTGSDGGGGDGGGGDVCVNTVTPAGAPHLHTDGSARAGEACMNAGCHLAGGGATPFTFSGTVYADMAGTTPKPGATVKVIFGTTTVSAVADDAGNFYSTQNVTLPARTLGTACPTVAPMNGQIVTGGGNCNTCHRTGGSTAPIYVQ